MTTNLQLSGMTCSACERVVTMKLAKIDGLSVISADAKKGNVTIQTASEIEKEKIESALKGTHYQVIKFG